MTNEELFDLYSRLVAEVEASMRGEPAPRDTLDRLRRMLMQGGEVAEVLEAADHEILRLCREIGECNPEQSSARLREFFLKVGLAYRDNERS